MEDVPHVSPMTGAAGHQETGDTGHFRSERDTRGFGDTCRVLTQPGQGQ